MNRYVRPVAIAGAILCMPMLFGGTQPASADTYEYSTYSSSIPMSRTVRTYTVAPVTTSTSTRTYVMGAPMIQRTVSSPVVIEKSSPVYVERNVSTPVYVERRMESPVVIERSQPVMIERSSPVIIEQKPVRIHRHHDHHLLNFGVTPLVKLKVL